MTDQNAQVALPELTAEQKEAIYQQMRKEKGDDERSNRIAYEEVRDEGVAEAIKIALELEQVMAHYKYLINQIVVDVVDILQDYGQIKKNQPNYTITASNKDKIKIQNNVTGDYDERAELAHEHILTFIKKHFKDQKDADFILKMIAKNKQGQFSKANIDTLIKEEDRYDDPNWKKGIELYKESFIEKGSIEYVNLYKAIPTGGEQRILLNFSTIQPKKKAEAPKVEVTENITE